MSQQKRQLKNFLINPKYQAKYIFWLTGTGFALILVLLGLIYFYVKENYDLLILHSPMTEEARQFLIEEVKTLIVLVVGGSTFFLVTVFFLGVYLSHRVAGPIYRIRNSIEELINGHAKQDRITLRPKDEFQDLADSLNRLIYHLKKK